ncbi:MAG: collagenase-like protease, partial [Firmicutes bacterium]|nr:collagenase-like protease [Bacillota bacterium]
MTNIIRKNIKKVELLAPAGNFEKLVTAIHFGADAVYLAGKKYGLRAYADNFSDDEI